MSAPRAPERPEDESGPASEALGLEVVNRRGQILGRVVEVAEAQGEEFVLLSTGGLPEGERVSPLPWRMLALERERHLLTVDLSPDRLAMGPSFARPTRPKPEIWSAEVLFYYGYTEERPGRQRRERGEGRARPGETPVSLPNLGWETVGPVVQEEGPIGAWEGPESGLTAEEEEGHTAEAEALLPGGPGESHRPLSEEQGMPPASEEEPLGAGESPGPVSADDAEEAGEEYRRRAA